MRDGEWALGILEGTQMSEKEKIHRWPEQTVH